MYNHSRVKRTRIHKLLKYKKKQPKRVIRNERLKLFRDIYFLYDLTFSLQCVKDERKSKTFTSFVKSLIRWNNIIARVAKVKVTGGGDGKRLALRTIKYNVAGTSTSF